jgi:hypothetical protein
MGMRMIGSKGDSYKTCPGNPNPAMFKLVRTVEVKNCTVALLQYVGCTNYEGSKIVVWKGVSAKWLKEQTVIDPHFTEDGAIIARFVPTDEGWEMAKMFAMVL